MQPDWCRVDLDCLQTTSIKLKFNCRNFPTESMSAKALAKLPPISGASPPPPPLASVISPRAGKAFSGLQGPTYHLGVKGDVEKHKLPDPKALKPYVDTKAGGLDTWPAHATAQAAARPSLPTSQRQRVSTSEDSRRLSSGDDAGPQQSMVPKPKFLEQLEVFLKKELRNVDGGRGGPSETRLQAYREVFEYLIEDFKTYKPIFSAIKNEYEVMLSHQREKIRELEPLKSMLVTVSEQCDQKIMSLREEERQEMRDLKDEKKELLNRIGAMKEEQVSLQMQIEKLQDKIAEQYQMYRDECDARKLLVSDINDLRYQQEDYQKAQGNQEAVSHEEKDDPVKMKIALKKAREDLTEATQKLNEMIANYGDVVPRRDFEFLKADHEKLQEEHETLKGDYSTLMAEHEALLEVNQQIIAQRDDFYQELENLKRTATPRPEWDRCADVLEGGHERWASISQGKKSNDLVTLLLKEIMGEGEGYEYFEPRGTDEEVPIYMRYEGPLRKRKMEKSDAGILIKEIWKEKTKQNQEREGTPPEPMDIFLASFMRQKYPEEKLAFEWTYNLINICETNEEDDHVNLFFQILKGEVDEDVYHDQLDTLASLMEAFTKADEEEGSKGSVNPDIFEHALREFYPLKDDDSIQALLDAAVAELKPEDPTVLLYQDLFTEEEDGTVGPFISKIRAQEKEEKMKYVDEIRRELEDKEEVPWRELQMAINVVDAEIDRAHMVQYVCRAFDVPQDQITTAQPTPLDVIVKRLQKSTTRRIGKLNSSELT